MESRCRRGLACDVIVFSIKRPRAKNPTSNRTVEPRTVFAYNTATIQPLCIYRTGIGVRTADQIKNATSASINKNVENLAPTNRTKRKMKQRRAIGVSVRLLVLYSEHSLGTQHAMRDKTNIYSSSATENKFNNVKETKHSTRQGPIIGKQTRTKFPTVVDRKNTYTHVHTHTHT